MNRLKYFFLFIFISIYSLVEAQNLKVAEGYLSDGNFEDAYEQFSLLYENDPSNANVKYKLSICILNLNQNKAEAINILEDLIKDAAADPNALYLLGRAYQYDYKFKEAIEKFKSFIKIGKGNADNLNNAGRQIEYCENAIELMKFPSSIEFENLGPNINSPFADYFPFVASDESFILFNSKRNNGGEKLINGTFSSDVYYSNTVTGKYQKAKPLSKKINSKKFNEEIVGLSSSNNKIIIFFSDDQFSQKGKLAIVEKNGHDFINKKNLPDIINTKYTEISATINQEGNEIYFASDMPGGYGGTDIYVSRILPNGEWGPAQNLGPAINTIYNEDFPVLSYDGKILYFSSKGHTSMGGYDIFKAEYDNEKMKFIRPRNLGFPINTPLDDMNFTVSESGKYGYISTVRKEGFGDYDIYRVSFNDIEPDFTIYNGKIITEENIELESISMLVTNIETGEIYGEYLPNLNTMRYVIILPPGNYELSIETENFESFTEQIEVLGKDAYQFEISKDIYLKKK